MSTAPPADWQAVRSPTTGTVVWVDGLRFVVHLDLPDLLDALSRGQLGRIIPGALTPAEQQTWVRHLLDHRAPFDVPDATAVAEAVVQDITGIPADTAVALARWLTTDWLLVDGYYLGRGVDLLTYPPRRLFAALYAFLVEHRYETRDKADHALFPAQLRQPTASDRSRDAANFEAAMAMATTLPGVG